MQIPTAKKQYDNTNRFVLFVNDRKEDDNDPDRTGSININGVEYFLNGWLKKDKNGRQYLSGSSGRSRSRRRHHRGRSSSAKISMTRSRGDVNAAPRTRSGGPWCVLP